MRKGERLSPAEFDAFMKERHLKRLKNMPKGETGFVVGCYFDIYFSDNKLVKCALCGTPLYVRPWILEIAQQYKFYILCQGCAPPEQFKGTMIQDLAAVVKHIGEK